MIKSHYLSIIFLIALLLGCRNSNGNQQPNDQLDTALEIMQKAHSAAGGEFWSQVSSLSLHGHANFFQGEDTLHNEVHNMWRVYTSSKTAAHVASGKVKIESMRKGEHVILVSYDGKNTYDLNGKREKSEADQMWSSNFGYGAIRHVFDKGYTLSLSGEDQIKGESTYIIKVEDAGQKETFFDITQDDYKIVKVAFDTPRGWHHRLYSEFFRKPEYNWLQAGRVELFYNNKISNEVFWTDFEVNKDLPDSLFVLTYDQ